MRITILGWSSRSGRHPQAGKHFRASIGAAGARVGTDLAMFMPICVAVTFRGAGAAKGNAGGELSLERLPISCLIRPRHHASRRGAHGRAIKVEADAGDQAFDMLFGQTGVRAGGAGF